MLISPFLEVAGDPGVEAVLEEGGELEQVLVRLVHHTPRDLCTMDGMKLMG